MLRSAVGVLVAGVLGVTSLPAQAPEPAAPLPVRRVVLYKTGVGYFEHVGDVQGTQNITIRFTSGQLNDVLKSLTAIDLGKGQITGISYNSVAPLQQRLGALRLPLEGSATAEQVLDSLRGARVEVTSAGTVATGRLLTVERRSEHVGTQIVSKTVFTVLSDTGEMRTYELSPAVRVRLADRDVRQELGRYLDILGSTREQDVRNMVLTTSGTGSRRLFVSYISEVPVWKSTYRLVVPEKGKPFLQGWAIVDNTVGEDWTNVQLSLVAGAPQSYIQRLSEPFYTQRPVVPLPSNVLLHPQTHGATLARGAGGVTGQVVDASRASIPGVTVSLVDSAGNVVAQTTTDADGEYRLPATSGTYELRAALAGFRPASVRNVRISSGTDAEHDLMLQVADLSEQVTVSSHEPVPPPPPPATPVRGGSPLSRADKALALEQLSQLEVAATASDLGELFEYRIKEPVTLRKNQSALVPILNAEITAEKVSLWNRGTASGRPLRSMWLTNTTGLTLDGGSVAIIDGEAFAGEGLIEPVKPGERRLISYAADLGVLVSGSQEGAPRRVHRLTARNGILIQEIEDRATWTYTARNEGTTPTTLVVEHTMRPGWKLADGQTPAETAVDAQRFRLVVEPGKEATLAVREVMPGTARVSIGQINSAMIAQLAASGISAAELERVLKPVLDKRAELDAVSTHLQNLSDERDRVVHDQARVRENMKALRGSAEERQLLQRYTRQLDEQETTLERLRQEIQKVSAERDAMNAELGKLIASTSFDLPGTR